MNRFRRNWPVIGLRIRTRRVPLTLRAVILGHDTGMPS